MKADIIIIGSGFGGSVAAARFAEAGLKVMVLERGPWRRTAPVERAGIAGAVPLPRQNRPDLTLRDIRPPFGPRQITLNKKGLLELHIGKGVTAIASSSVGGGSHVWGAAMARPDTGFWNGWADGLSEQEMSSHYERVSAELGACFPNDIVKLPNHTSHGWKETGWFQPIAEDEQYPMAVLYPQEQGGNERRNQNRLPSDLSGNDGMFGCPSAAKATTDSIYLLPNLGAKLTVLDLHEARFIERTSKDGYSVHFRDLRNKTNGELHAPIIILAAGTLNSVRILFESQRRNTLAPMPGLGKGFGTNGDVVAAWRPNDRERDGTIGLPIHGRLKVAGQPEEMNLLLAAPERPPLPRWMPGFLANKANNVANKFQVVAMGKDRADGEMSYSRGRLNLRYDLNGSPIFSRIFAILDKLAEASGAPLKFNRKNAMTAHPMGGCRIGRSASEAVVDGRGQVYGNPGLYVADASAFPAPTGTPPSLSIAAWSSHVAEGIIAAPTAR